MTKAIWILIFLVVGYLGFVAVKKWNETQNAQAEAGDAPAHTAVISGDKLPGMPHQLESSYQAAKTKGSKTFQAWFAANERLISDPRKAWIELELCAALFRENPAEARKIYNRVKERVPPTSPVWPRVQELAATFG